MSLLWPTPPVDTRNHFPQTEEERRLFENQSIDYGYQKSAYITAVTGRLLGAAVVVGWLYYRGKR